MEVFMTDILFSATRHDVVRKLASILHGPGYVNQFSSLLINFHVQLHRRKQGGNKQHSGSGILTLPSVAIGEKFLNEYGERSDQRLPSKTCSIGRRRIKFSSSKNTQIRRDVLETISRLPYQDPSVAEEEERRQAVLRSGVVNVRQIQFGWDTRDYLFSVEWEHDCSGHGCLLFDYEQREIRIKQRHSSIPTGFLVIAIRLPSIQYISVHTYLGKDPVIYFQLWNPPSFEVETDNSLRKRLTHLPISGHERVAPYTSRSLRLICASENDLREFQRLYRAIDSRALDDNEYLIVRRNIFSASAIQQLQRYYKALHWIVVFQVEALVRKLVVDVQEMLQLLPQILHLSQQKGKVYTAAMLRHFNAKATITVFDSDVFECFSSAKRDYAELAKGLSLSTAAADLSLYDSLHVIVTPTTYLLDGPFPERSNRVIRWYHKSHHECFLRVSFMDEGRLQFRSDRNVDGKDFIHRRLGKLFSEGLTIAGRNFAFLAYSQSALKEHAVWFVKPFRDPEHGYTDASTIIKKIGNFTSEDLLRCPARYAARISQAFTATDASTVEVEEILLIDDVTTPDEKYTFTDGVGTMSRELAKNVWAELKATKRRSRNRQTPLSALQIRLMGSKGMLSIDHKLRGHTICLRPSMIKFDSPDSTQVEIARAFDRPGRFFLNRPLIMLLEDLKVPYETFEYFQDKAVAQVRRVAESLEVAGRMLENFGLGTSYRLTSVLLGLAKLGLENLFDDSFYKSMLQYAVHHILRDLKNHARIPVDGAWTLVGVADIHKHLKAGEIFACIKPVDSEMIYLQGPVLITRSPVVHPGDVQVVQAIGKPPRGSCFEREPLVNTVVFSIQGSRPLASCLGGGDLDGDVYNVIPLKRIPGFRPKVTYQPAEYAPAKRKLLDRDCTMMDVAEFVMEYIHSDVLGLVAINWLTIADQNAMGILHPDCLKLSQLHSDAVDYPKSGQPVDPQAIPKLHFRRQPDWRAPETVNPSSAHYYESQRAIGRLFRKIDLPMLHSESAPSRPERRRIRQGRPRREDVNGLTDSLGHVHIDDNDLVIALEDRLAQFHIPIHEPHRDITLDVSQIWQSYLSEFETILGSHTLSHGNTAILTEEEAILGTIAAKTSQPRKRSDAMARLREHTDRLVKSTKERLAGDDDQSSEESCLRAWVAWQLSRTQSRTPVVGARSFGWIALGEIFDSVKEIEDREREFVQRRFGR